MALVTRFVHIHECNLNTILISHTGYAECTELKYNYVNNIAYKQYRLMIYDTSMASASEVCTSCVLSYKMKVTVFPLLNRDSEVDTLATLVYVGN